MFQVEWLQLALNELAAIWMLADSVTRQAITAATNTIDAALRQKPQHRGESRDNGKRVFFCHPLGITFEVDSPRSLVRVLHVWDMRRKKG